MSSEIILLNKLGVAIAADSAITVGNRAAIFNTGEKIFPFPKGFPVCAMYYANTDFMGIPIEIILPKFIESIATKPQAESLKDYAENFVQYIEKNQKYFQFETFEKHYVNSLFKVMVNQYLRAFDKDNMTLHESIDDQNEMINAFSLLKETNEIYKKYSHEVVKTVTKDEFQKYFEPLLKTFIEKSLSLDNLLTDDKVSYFYDFFKGYVFESLQYHDNFEHHSSTSIYFVGYGQTSLFPGYIGIQLFALLNGKLRYRFEDSATIDQLQPGLYKTLAQDDAIESFFIGINLQSALTINQDIQQHIEQTFETFTKENRQDETFIHSIKNKVMANINNETYFMNYKRIAQEKIQLSLSSMGLFDLADYAKNLINLQSIRRKYEVDIHQQATVGGPIKVAMIDRFNGFRWFEG
jgi:hypothetical protein